MKAILFALLLIALVFAQSPELTACIEQKCPDQYKKCKATSGCEDKLKKCATKCGEKVNQTCWTLCLGVPGAAANVCLCAVNVGCIANSSVADRLGLTLMNAISNFESNNIQSQWKKWSHSSINFKTIVNKHIVFFSEIAGAPKEIFYHFWCSRVIMRDSR